MKKKILVNAAHPEERRVAIIEDSTLVDFYVEVTTKEHLKGNIYKGVVVRIEPGLQAAFVDFGQKKHGFLQIKELTPDFFKGPSEHKRRRIQDVLTKGQELMVQVEKEERDTKGASLTTYISLPGRYMVMMPGQKMMGISRKIEDKEDRDRLKEVFSSLELPENVGFILRTAGSDKTKKELSSDLKYLDRLWSRIQAEAEKAPAPSLIYKEHDIAVKTVRDYLTSDVGEVLVDDKEACKNMKEFLKKTVPWRRINIKQYKEKTPLFLKYNIEDQIAKIHDRYVYLPSRGYLVFDKAEALTAIDVNSGRSRKEENVESTALRTNLEAADEIARHLRLRDIGGLIVIDFIDMVSSKNRKEVETRLKKALSTDKAHADIGSISKFGMLEMTRERLRPSYMESQYRKCDVCDGTGSVRTEEMTAVGAFRAILAKASEGGIKGIQCSLPVDCMNYLVNTKRDTIAEIEKEFSVTVKLFADPKLFPGQYSISVEKIEEEKAEPGKGERHPHRTERKTEHETAQRIERGPVQKPVEKGEGGRHSGRRSRGRRRSRSKQAVHAAAATGTPAGPGEGVIAPEAEERLDEPSLE